jgi:hypothetical protein
MEKHAPFGLSLLMLKMSNGKNIVPFELADIETPNCKEAICNGF